MINRNDYASTKEFFFALTDEPKKNGLLQHLAENPQLITEQDEEGQTLLHHAILQERTAMFLMEPYMTKEALSVQDSQGRTPVHVASASTDGYQQQTQIVPFYLRKANEVGYDFTLTDHHGETPLTTAIYNPSYNIRLRYPYDMVEYFTRYVPSVNVNQLHEKSGISPLALTIGLGRLNEAETLLNLGADPSLYQDHSNNEFPSDPFARINLKIKMAEEKIQKMTEKLANGGYKEKERQQTEAERNLGIGLAFRRPRATMKTEQRDNLQKGLLKLQELKLRMSSIFLQNCKEDNSNYVSLLPQTVVDMTNGYISPKP